MSADDLKRMVGEVLAEVADLVDGAPVAPSVRVGVTAVGSERGPEEVIRGAELAASRDGSLEVVVIGPAGGTALPTMAAESEEAGHAALEAALEEGRFGGAVTLHYPFPMGVATVGRVVTPGRGKEMLIATCTGAADADRVTAVVKNVVLGRAVAASLGWDEPSVGLCTVDGARQAERALRALAAGGYPLRWAESIRADGGPLMRGNDCLWGTADILVCDTLTGNLLVKLFSAFTTGGSYEAFGFGYGPGVGEG
ncbi:MAG: glycine reductase, partial [Nitrospinota bacterium]